MALAHLVQALAGRPEVQRIVLFGSRAREDAAARSDIDLAIEAPDATRRQWLELTLPVEEAQTLLPIDLVRLEEASPALRAQILAQGKTLYDRAQSSAKPAQSRTGAGALACSAQEPDANSLVVDGTIQRFEFVIELYWKTLRRLLAAEGILANTPRESLQQAYQAQWLTDETAWLEMLRDRNESSHTYDEATARRIYANIKRNSRSWSAPTRFYTSVS
jgi:nucleotidyltransferase substrate binding protein (TIGR01987 family)